eukprot:m.933290 g.933290  ORF g.933290 m.933290 type:complete len:326 (-) comp23795_c0_seq35:200-1177(-)
MEDTTDNAMDGVREASHVSASAQEELSFFVCQQCRYPIVSESEILFDKAEIFTDQVYSYEMEVLVDKTAWCYSATNPGAHRFDVLRIKKPPHGRVSFDGLPTLEHTWFPGHKWVYCQCGACGQHLGWGYCAKGTTEEAGAAGPDSTEPAGNNGSLNMETSASQVYPAEPNVLQPPQNDLHEEQEPDNPAEDEVVFCGLILTRLAPQSLTAADMATFDATLVRAASHSHLFQQHMQELVELLHSVPTVVVADYIPAVLELNVSPAARLRSEAVLDSVRSVVEEYLREQNVVADEARVGAQHVEEGGGRSDDENRSSDGDTSDGDQH